MVVVGWKNESGSKEMGEVVSSKKLKKNNDRCPGGDKEKCGAAAGFLLISRVKGRVVSRLRMVCGCNALISRV
jgi:hypothetical protein